MLFHHRYDNSLYYIDHHLRERDKHYVIIHYITYYHVKHNSTYHYDYCYYYYSYCYYHYYYYYYYYYYYSTAEDSMSHPPKAI